MRAWFGAQAAGTDADEAGAAAVADQLLQPVIGCEALAEE